MNKKIICGLIVMLSCGVAGAQALDTANIPPDDAIVAERGGIKITVGEMRAKVRTSVPATARKGYFESGASVSSLIESMLLTRQIAAEARSKGLDQEPDIKTEIEEAVLDLLSRRQVGRYLDAQPEPDYEVLAKERYMAKKEDFTTPPRRDVRHILILKSDKPEAEAKAIAEKVHELLVQGKDFDEVFNEYTEDPARSLNGWVNNVWGDRYDPAFLHATWNLENIGDISEPVLSKFGYHVIRLEKDEAPRLRPYEEVREELVKKLKEEVKTATREAYITEFSSQPLKLNDEALKNLPAIEIP